MFNFDDIAWSATAFGVAGYLGAVIYQGNPQWLVAELSKEGGYVEFAIAGYLLFLLVQNRQVGKIAGPLVTLAVIAALIRAMQSSEVQAALQNFAAGRAGLFETLIAATGQDKLVTTETK